MKNLFTATVLTMEILVIAAVVAFIFAIIGPAMIFIMALK